MNNPLLTETIGVYFINMDTAVSEQVVQNEDDSFSIFINARLGWERQMEAYQHALRHIMNDDFSKRCADDIEKAL
mgnify:FL=1